MDGAIADKLTHKLENGRQFTVNAAAAAAAA